MKPWIFPVVLAAMGLLALGCGESAGPECVTSADCEGGAICLDRECQTLGCQGGCPDGTYCDETNDECVGCDVDDHCGTGCRDCTVATNDLCAGSCQNGACVYPESSCGFCLTCDGQGNCVDVPAGEDSFDDCAGGPPCGQVCSGDGGCLFPGSNVQCGLTCQRCDGAGTCLPDCSQTECIQNIWECQCHPVQTSLTCGSTAGGNLTHLADTTDLFDTYGQSCNWTGNTLDGREMTFPFSFTGSPSPRLVTVTVYSVCGESEMIGIALAGSEPCDPTDCVISQNHGGFY